MITPLLLSPALKAANVHEIANLTWGEVKYGNFLSSIIKFIMVALVLFSVIKTLNAFKKKEDEAPAAPVAPSTTDQLLTEIRDALKK